MIEDEAKQKLCCGPEGCGRGAKAYAGGNNGPDIVYVKRYCVGSACMAWRLEMGGGGRCGLADRAGAP